MESTPDGADVVLAECEYFTVRRLRIDGAVKQTVDTATFHSLIITEGEGMLNMNGDCLTFQKGDSLFIPAQNGEYVLDGTCEAILSYI